MSSNSKSDFGLSNHLCPTIFHIFEKDTSTFNKKDTVGILYSWGLNNNGQLGSILQVKLYKK